MEFWHSLMEVLEINLVTRAIGEKQINLVPSFTGVSFIISLNIKSMTIP